MEHEQRVTLEIEGWLSDRKIKLKDLHKVWSEKLRVDVAQIHARTCAWEE